MRPYGIRLRKGGNTILAQDHDFMKGYELGYAYYVTTCRHLPILDTGIYEFVVGTILGVRHSGRWNAGVIVGWIAALLDHEQEPSVQTEPLVLATHKETPTC